MSVFFRLLAIQFMTLATAVGFSAQSLPVYADTVSDCVQGKSQDRIRACSELITTGEINGKKMESKELYVAYNNRGNAYKETGELNLAIADYDHAVNLVPDLATAYYNRGLAYFEKKDLDIALENYDIAIKFDPKFFKSYGSRGLAYEQKGATAEAIADYQKALELNPKDQTSIKGLKRLQGTQ